MASTAAPTAAPTFELKDLCGYAKTVNGIVSATVAFGVVSLLACFAVLAVSFAHCKDTQSLRERLVLGLIVANIVVSVGNTIPIHLVHDDSNDPSSCGTFVIGYEAGLTARAIWIGGTCAIGTLEVAIIAFTIRALQIGVTTAPAWVEVAVQAFCATSGVAAGVTYKVHTDILRSDQLRDLDTCAVVHPDHTSAAYVACVQAARHSMLRDAYVTKLDLMRVFIALFSVAILMFIVFKLIYRRLLTKWGAEFASAREQWSRDLWAPEDKPKREQLQRLLLMQREAHASLAAPLEPFVFVYFLFGPPAIVLATEDCKHNSDAPGRFCGISCEMVLALRSAATAMTYFADAACRAQLLDPVDLAHRLRRRVARLVGCGGESKGVQWRSPSGLEQTHVIPRASVGTASLAEGGGGDDVAAHEPNGVRAAGGGDGLEERLIAGDGTDT